MSISNSQSAWTLDGSFYKQTVNLGSGEVLQCGADNTTPPIIIWDRTTGSENIFSTISRAEVNNDRNAITFYVPVGFFNQFTGNLGVIIIDHR